MSDKEPLYSVTFPSVDGHEFEHIFHLFNSYEAGIQVKKVNVMCDKTQTEQQRKDDLERLDEEYGWVKSIHAKMVIKKL